MRNVLSEELCPTPLDALQVMVAKVLSLITLIRLRIPLTLNSVVVSSVAVLLSSAESTPSRNQTMVGVGTPVAVHTNTTDSPSDTVTVGFWAPKMAATAAA